MEAVHAATLRTEPVAPGQIVFLQKIVFPQDARILFGDVAAPILQRSQDRLSVQVPASLRDGPAEVSVTAGSTVISKAALTITRLAPGLLTLGDGTGQAVAANETGEANNAASPAARGSIVTLYLTGEGTQQNSVRVQIGGSAADVVWAGTAPGWPGLYQVNVRTPGGFSPSGVVPVTVTINGVSSQSGVTIVSR
jgi:uncharacterized protein (TIGR03437 family)